MLLRGSVLTNKKSLKAWFFYQSEEMLMSSGWGMILWICCLGLKQQHSREKDWDSEDLIRALVSQGY